jgi:hypothetical protein
LDPLLNHKNLGVTPLGGDEQAGMLWAYTQKHHNHMGLSCQAISGCSRCNSPGELQIFQEPVDEKSWRLGGCYFKA